MRTKDFTEEQIKTIINLYVNDKLSTITIGLQFNIGKKAINQLLKRHNVELRTPSEAKYKGGKTLSNKRYREKDGKNEKQKEYMKVYYPKYQIENNEKIKLYRHTYKPIRNEKHKQRMESDSLYKLNFNIRCLIRKGFKKTNHNKKSKSKDILGCSFEEFKLHIESLWESWMTWENYGNPKDGIYELNKSWDLDHIIPISTAITEDDVIRLNHYSNLQPLCSYTNRWIKKDK